jgi:hypothetical protein
VASFSCRPIDLGEHALSGDNLGARIAQRNESGISPAAEANFAVGKAMMSKNPLGKRVYADQLP